MTYKVIIFTSSLSLFEGEGGLGLNLGKEELIFSNSPEGYSKQLNIPDKYRWLGLDETGWKKEEKGIIDLVYDNFQIEYDIEEIDEYLNQDEVNSEITNIIILHHQYPEETVIEEFSNHYQSKNIEVLIKEGKHERNMEKQYYHKVFLIIKKFFSKEKSFQEIYDEIIKFLSLDLELELKIELLHKCLNSEYKIEPDYFKELDAYDASFKDYDNRKDGEESHMEALENLRDKLLS